MKVKSLKALALVVVFNVALISCSQNVSLDTSQESTDASSSEASQTLTYRLVDTLDGIRYEVPSDWQTYYDGDKAYHYHDGDDYLMVGSVTTEFSKDTDRVLTDHCADTLIESLSDRTDFLLETDCSGDVDGAYCRRLVCYYTDEDLNAVVERSVTFSVNGTVYSFDCVSYGDRLEGDEDFRRIVGSIIVTTPDG